MANGVEASASFNPLRSLYRWVMKNAHGPHAWAVLAGISFAEASFFPLPPDIMLVPMVLHDRKRAHLIAGWAVLWSVLGGFLGYAIGSLLYDSVGRWLIEVYGMGGGIEEFRENYVRYGPLIVLQGVTPIPYKLVTIASGFAGLSLPLFFLFSVAARTVRFAIVAGALYRYGEPLREVIERWLELILLGMLVLIVAGFFIARAIFS